MKKPTVLRGSAKHLELEGGLRRFDYFMLNLPFACNYSCSKCCNAILPKTVGRRLAFEEIRPLVSEAKSIGARVMVIAGEGEPFLDKNLPKIVEAAANEGLIPYIFTNGSLLGKQTIDFLKKNRASLVVNIDSLNEKTYEFLVGEKGSFHRLMNNLEILRNEYPSISEESNGYWIVGAAINTVISHQNASEVFPPSGKEPMREFCGDDFALVYNTPFLKGNAEQHPSIFNMAENLLQEISTRTEGNIPLGTTSDGQWCAYMRNGISVGACGEILTCAYSIGTGNSFGNTRDGGLLKYAELVNQKVDAFYASDGHARCILRHPNYAKYIH